MTTHSKYIVQTMQNLTACDTIFKRGSTQRLLAEDAFDTEVEAMSLYNQLKNSLRFAGLAGQYVTYPRKVENYQPTEIYDKFCDYCGNGISKDNETYTEIKGSDYCSKFCLVNDGILPSNDPDRYEEQYEED